ncbi:hypothetical protein NWP21_15870 [Anabaenopsis sp. FSS-46]|nr:hypothetical protein [Anabaenopsis sp. FSS-46]MDH6100288.1 hypothetical protein [Anabaenopsis sp. FSS-46]
MLLGFKTQLKVNKQQRLLLAQQLAFLDRLLEQLYKSSVTLVQSSG